MNCKSELYKIKYNNVNNNYIIIFKDMDSDKSCEFHVKNTDAKNIALANENIPSYRLKTYNLVFNFLNAFSIKIDKANIYKKNGEVISELILYSGQQKTKINANFIDSIVLCLQSFSLIYINDSLFNSINTIDVKFNNVNSNSVKQISDNNYFSENQKIINLNKALEDLINQEKYESAAKVRDLISVYNKNKK